MNKLDEKRYLQKKREHKNNFILWVAAVYESTFLHPFLVGR